jgi:hypothetical protein
MQDLRLKEALDSGWRGSPSTPANFRPVVQPGSLAEAGTKSPGTPSQREPSDQAALNNQHPTTVICQNFYDIAKRLQARFVRCGVTFCEANPQPDSDFIRQIGQKIQGESAHRGIRDPVIVNADLR